ncbi:hypothetical protein Dalu01_00473 [Deinococcus aluminii]|uniref:Uncharacterized protein n=1 Tax=Deinococcus aluminii TaxID=1656885 RepID=A0ABP9X9P6_9DEIO
MKFIPVTLQHLGNQTQYLKVPPGHIGIVIALNVILIKPHGVLDFLGLRPEMNMQFQLAQTLSELCKIIRHALALQRNIALPSILGLND